MLWDVYIESRVLAYFNLSPNREGLILVSTFHLKADNTIPA